MQDQKWTLNALNIITSEYWLHCLMGVMRSCCAEFTQVCFSRVWDQKWILTRWESSQVKTDLHRQWCAELQLVSHTGALKQLQHCAGSEVNTDSRHSRIVPRTHFSTFSCLNCGPESRKGSVENLHRHGATSQGDTDFTWCTVNQHKLILTKVKTCFTDKTNINRHVQNLFEKNIESMINRNKAKKSE